MAFKIAVASGKGGTGKTTVAVNLFYYLHERIGDNIQLADCDVEEPNDAIFFSHAAITNEQDIYQLVPEIDKDKCTYCRKCAEYCEFNAIVVMPSAQFAEVNKSLCHSCGACKVACNFGAISEVHYSLGTISHIDPGIGQGLIQGSLRIGSSMQTMMVKAVKKQLSKSAEIVILDAPPGTSCPVVETVSDADVVLLVTEPTPFGMHDLKLMIKLLREIKKPFHVIMNKAGIGNDEIYKFLESEKISILGEIPFSEAYASSYATGNLFKNIPMHIKSQYLNIVSKVENELVIYEGNNYFKW